MKIVNCALLYADGDKYVWSVVTEGASEFPIDMELVADGSIWENDGVKSVLTDGSWVAESSGGGVSFPTFTAVENTWECDMTYAEVESAFNREALGMPTSACPCVCQESAITYWGTMSYHTKETIDDSGVTFNPSLPETIVGGFAVRDIEDLDPFGLYADDGNFYEVINK